MDAHAFVKPAFELMDATSKTSVGKFLNACSLGRLHIAQWLYGNFNIARDDAMADDYYPFRWACDRGHLKTAKWFHEIFKLTRKEALYDADSSFQWACENGHLHIVKWLHKTFGLTRENVIIYNSRAFRLACSGGHFRVVRWLHENFRLTSEEVNYTIFTSWEWGDVIKTPKIVEWLKSNSLVCETGESVAHSANGLTASTSESETECRSNNFTHVDKID